MLPHLAERAFELMAAAPVPGALVEFGVYQGNGLEAMVRLARRHLGMVPPVYGFDSFAGMPPSAEPLVETLARFWAPGTFQDTSRAAVQRRMDRTGAPVTLIESVFSELRPLSEYGIDKIRFANLDGDIYEGYRDPLRLFTPHVQVGTVLRFDESVPPNEWRYQSVRHHGQRAVREWEQATGVNLHLIRFEWTAALCVIVDEDYLRSHWRVIDRLRKDTIGESVRNIAKVMLGRELEARVHLS